MSKSTGLTAYQIGLLTRARASKHARITNWYGDPCTYKLMTRNDGDEDSQYENIKTGIGYPWHDVLRAFFERTRYADGTQYYRMRPNASIDNEWMLAELKQQQLAQENTRNIEAARIEGERQRSIDYLNAGTSGPFAAELSGQFGWRGFIAFNGERVADIGPYHYSSADKTFDALLTRPENVATFERIRQMITAANASIATAHSS